MTNQNSGRRLNLVSNELPDTPYPPETKANGWCPVQDIDRIISSETWVLAEEDERPWLLRIWMEAWRSVPVGSMPSDRRLFARRIGCKPAFLEAHAEILMRGWVLFADGNLYHGFIISQVLDMLETRQKNREKLRKWRKEQEEKEALRRQMAQENPEDCNRLHEPCNRSVTVSNRCVTTMERKGKELRDKSTNVLSSKPAAPVIDLSGQGEESKPAIPPCPHKEIVDLYHDILPELPRITFSLWLNSKDAQSLASIWKADKRHRDLEFWRKFFLAVRTNSHWMGNNSPWKANLRWLVTKSHFIAGVELMVNNQFQRNGSHG